MCSLTWAKFWQNTGCVKEIQTFNMETDCGKLLAWGVLIQMDVFLFFTWGEPVCGYKQLYFRFLALGLFFSPPVRQKPWSLLEVCLTLRETASNEVYSNFGNYLRFSFSPELVCEKVFCFL